MDIDAIVDAAYQRVCSTSGSSSDDDGYKPIADEILHSPYKDDIIEELQNIKNMTTAAKYAYNIYEQGCAKDIYDIIMSHPNRLASIEEASATLEDIMDCSSGFHIKIPQKVRESVGSVLSAVLVIAIYLFVFSLLLGLVPLIIFTGVVALIALLLWFVWWYFRLTRWT